MYVYCIPWSKPLLLWLSMYYNYSFTHTVYTKGVFGDLFRNYQTYTFFIELTYDVSINYLQQYHTFFFENAFIFILFLKKVHLRVRYTKKKSNNRKQSKNFHSISNARRYYSNHSNYFSGQVRSIFYFFLAVRSRFADVAGFSLKWFVHCLSESRV